MNKKADKDLNQVISFSDRSKSSPLRNSISSSFYVASSSPEVIFDETSTEKTTSSDALLHLSSMTKEIDEDIEDIKEVNNMNNDDFLMKYIDKLDRDQSDLKKDVNESEKRIVEFIKSSEERNEKLIGRIENTIDKQTLSVESKIAALENKIDSNNKFIISISVTTVLAIAGLVITTIINR